VDAHAFDPAERDLSDLRREGFARAFIALHGRHGEDGTVQGALELLGIPYTGSGVMASAIAMDKVMTKRVWLAEGLPTPRWVWLAPDAADARARAHVPDDLGLPLIVKPPREGSSIGITKVAGLLADAGRRAAGRALRRRRAVRGVHRGHRTHLPGAGPGRTARALPVVRIDAPEGNYDYQHKYFTDDTEVPAAPAACRPRGSRGAAPDAGRLPRAGLPRLGPCRPDAARQRPPPFLLEMNTSPGMTGHSLVPMSARAAGISYEAAVPAPAAARQPGRRRPRLAATEHTTPWPA
jgi:D-alanine-D-alanine ligase